MHYSVYITKGNNYSSKWHGKPVSSLKACADIVLNTATYQFVAFHLKTSGLLMSIIILLNIYQVSSGGNIFIEAGGEFMHLRT